MGERTGVGILSGIYIHMEMPLKGYRLLLIHADGTVQSTDGEMAAVSVPDHGRLVDADALTTQMERNLFAIEDEAEKELGFDETLRRGMQYGHAVCVDAVNAAPTVIPADKEG
jgi:hypothetical protein